MKFKRNLLILSAILIGVLIVVAGCLPAPTTPPPVDTDAPKLSTAVYTDVDSSGTVNLNDRVVFTFNEEMLTSTVTSTNVATSLPLSAGNYGTGATISWDTTLKICTVKLGTSPTIVSGTTVNPSYLVTDVAGNADNSTAVAISGLTAITVLSSVSISPPTAIATVGTTSTTTFTASALSTAGGTMTSSCTFTWSISPATGRGSISSTTGTSIVYTFPSVGTAGTATIIVSAVKTGTTTPVKTDTSTVIVSAVVTPPTPTVDPAKLFVSAQTGKVKYTALPAGAISVTVYSAATKDPVAAVAAAAKATIILNDVWTAWSVAINANEYIYFMIAYSDGTTSPVTYDGQLPDKPDTAALAKIQATSENAVTSTAAGNVAATDKITLYILSVQKSNPASVGSTMTFVYNLAAGDVPTYTRTNANGHESAVSVADGQILELISAAAANGGGSLNVLDVGDTLTLGFTSGLSVDVTANITVSHISWVTTGAALLGTGTLAGIGAGTMTVVLTATATCADFTGVETVTFNISDTVPIVDTAGGNRVLPRATGFTFTGGASF